MQTTPIKSLLLIILLLTLAGMPQAQAVTRGFFAAKPVPGATEEFAKKILTADFNGDGKPDFATLHWEIDDRCKVRGVDCERGFFVEVYLNTTPTGARDATFQFTTELPYIHGEWRFYPVWENDMTLDDVNGDGITDIILANAHNDVILTYLGIADPVTKKGTGRFNSPIETVVDDDPTYITLGYFATKSGLKQLYIQHYKKNDWSKSAYNISSSVYQFNQNASLTKIGDTYSDTTGHWEFLYSPYYHPFGNSFTATVPKNAVVLPSQTLPLGIVSDGTDMVMQNIGSYHPLWLHSINQGQLAGNYTVDSESSGQFYSVNECPGGRSCWFGGHLSDFYSATRHAFSGSTIIKILNAKTNQWDENRYDRSLDAALSNKVIGASQTKLTPKEFGYYGSAIFLDDLDQDGQIDLLLLSDELYSGVSTDDDFQKPHNIEQSILVAYGTSSDQHPLNVDPAIGFDTDRIKMLTNASGRWHLGQHHWHWALDDFNGDGYKDLITLTDNGIMVHTNYGNFAQEAVPPVLNDMSINTIKTGATITVNGNFRTGDLLANWIELTDRTMGRDPTKYLLVASPVPTPANSNAPITQMTCIIPADKIKSGTYELRVTNTLARSTRFLTLTVQ